MIKKSWQKVLQENTLKAEELFEYLCLDQASLQHINHKFPIKTTKNYASRIKKNDIHDPLLKQILPNENILAAVPGYSDDPLNEKNAIKVPGLLHKYHGRVLVTVTGACAIHCQYCFRQHYPYEGNTPSRAGWKNIVNYISENPSISEVIYSGGDPLMAKDSLLAELTEQLVKIKHLKRLRIHTRLPVVLPQRICDEFFDWMDPLSLQKVMVLHINHPNEIDNELIDAVQKLSAHKITVLNQSVLLRGVNDSAETLAELSEKLFSCGVMPYYLHMLDKVHGAEDFEVDEKEALSIFEELRKKVSGFLLPRLVREVAGELSKVAML